MDDPSAACNDLGMMELSVRRPPYLIPAYSLTGDLLSFQRCQLQYRLGTIGNLPATRPVQLWFGQFIHGVMEEAFRRYRRSKDATGTGHFPASQELQEIIDLITRRLGASGLRARNRDLETVGFERARAAMHDLAPELFPIISEAEIPLSGTRHLPQKGWPSNVPRRESDRYEMSGVVDVITEIQLDDPQLRGNRIVSAIQSAVPRPLPTRFEIIVDYKGMRRPALTPLPRGADYWRIYEWQLQTYAQLRSVQTGARPVVGAALVFLNEFHQTWSDVRTLREEVKSGRTDIVPAGVDAQALAVATRERVPVFSFAFRLARALRVVHVTPASQKVAAEHFDQVVFDIELARAKERQSPHIRKEWPANDSDEATCAACDWLTTCPAHPGLKPKLPPPAA